MNSKTRMLAAMRGEAIDQVPVAPIYLHLYLASAIRRHAFFGFKALVGERTEIPLDPAAYVAIRSRAIRDAWKSLRDVPDWIWGRLAPPAAWLAQCVLRQEESRLWLVHLLTGEREELSALEIPTDSTADMWQRRLPATRDEVEALVPIQTTEELLANGELEIVRQMVAAERDGLFVTGTLGTPFWKSYGLLGFQGLMTMPAEEPGLFHYLQERQTVRLRALIRAFAALGVDGLYLEECLVSADVISPRLYDRFVFPYDRVLLDEARTCNLPTVLYVCGDVMPRLPRLVELAPTVLAFEESKKGFHLDLGKIAAALGKRLAVFGNLDATSVKDWSDAELTHQLRLQRDAAVPARGFIASMGSPFPLDTPQDRVEAFIRLARSPVQAHLPISRVQP